MPVVVLSAQFVNTATCPEGKNKENFYSHEIKGFLLEVRASGSMTYAVRYRDSHNRQIQHKIGDTKSISFDKAKNAARQIRSRVVLGEDPAGEKRNKRLVPTLDEFSRDRYFPYAKGYKRSWRSDDSIYRNHLLPQFGRCHLDEISHQSIIEFYHGLLAVGYAKATCNRVLVLIRLMFNLAKKWKIPGAEFNPASGVPLFDANNARERYLTVEETQRLHAELEHSGNPQLKNIIALLLLLGCRKRELLDSRWEQFDLERRSWRIPMSKSGKARHVPLSNAALAVLALLPKWDRCPYVVPNPKSRQPYSSVYRTWNTARLNAGLPEVRMHDLRHSMASNLVNSGRSILEVSKILGHSQLKTSQRYAHLSQDTLLAAVDAAADATGTNWSLPYA
ncbi:MAG: tyrosine-type recombinase/integrase [Desulfuromonadaceae bacterium]